MKNNSLRGGAVMASKGRPLAGIVLLVSSLWVLSCLDASGKWLMAEGLPLLVVAWFRYIVHMLLVLALVLPLRGPGVLRSVLPREQVFRGAAMFLATLLFFTTLSYLPQAEATAINFLAPLIVLALAPWLLGEKPRLSRWVACAVAFAGVLVIIRPSGGLHPLGVMFGLLTAWVLVRYSFFGKRVINALVDLPFALPTAVAGIALTAIYAGNGWIGQYLEPLGIKVAYTPLGIIVALIFIGLPFVVRSVEPVLEDLGVDLEEAALSLGARPWQVFLRVTLPAILPALLTGFALAFARGVGEYGSVIFIAGNMPYKSEIAPLLIVTQLEQYDYAAATAIATVMLVASFGILLAINLVQAWSRRRLTA